MEVVPCPCWVCFHDYCVTRKASSGPRMGMRVREKMNNEREKNTFLKLLGKCWMRREQFRGERYVGNLAWHSLVIPGSGYLRMGQEKGVPWERSVMVNCTCQLDWVR